MPEGSELDPPDDVDWPEPGVVACLTAGASSLPLTIGVSVSKLALKPSCWTPPLAPPHSSGVVGWA